MGLCVQEGACDKTGVPIAVGLTLLLSLTAPNAAPVDSRQTLAQAIKLFQNFEDARAEAVFRELLGHTPPRAVAGKAHLYLGLIAINRVDADAAIAEFRRALLSDPTIDLVPGSSPKARLAFDEARRSELEAPSPPAQPVSPTVLAPASSAEENATAKRASGHALAITLGALGIVAAGVGVYGGVDLLEYNSQVSSSTKGSVRYSSQLQSAGSQAGFWAVAWIPFVVAGALGIGAGVLTW
jgi:hypothetical protein